MTYQPPLGDVARWHAHPEARLRNSGDTIESHQRRCVLLLKQIKPNASQSLIDAVRYHDEAERWIGDMPYMTKKHFPELAEWLRDAEMQIMKKYGIPQPSSTFDKNMVKIVDRLDAYLWMLDRAPDLAETPDWEDALGDLIELSVDMCVIDEVAQILDIKGVIA